MPDETPPPRRLTRGHDRRLGGVLGGIAEYLGSDPTLVRVLYVALLILGFLPFGILLYFVLWIVMPEPEGDAPPPRPAGAAAGLGSDPAMLLGIVLLAVGAVALFGLGWATPWAWFGVGAFRWMFHLLWPLVLIGLGLWLVMSSRRRA